MAAKYENYLKRGRYPVCLRTCATFSSRDALMWATVIGFASLFQSDELSGRKEVRRRKLEFEFLFVPALLIAFLGIREAMPTFAQDRSQTLSPVITHGGIVAARLFAELLTHGVGN